MEVGKKYIQHAQSATASNFFIWDKKTIQVYTPSTPLGEGGKFHKIILLLETLPAIGFTARHSHPSLKHFCFNKLLLSVGMTRFHRPMCSCAQVGRQAGFSRSPSNWVEENNYQLQKKTNIEKQSWDFNPKHKQENGSHLSIQVQ